MAEFLDRGRVGQQRLDLPDPAAAGGARRRAAGRARIALLYRSRLSIGAILLMLGRAGRGGGRAARVATPGDARAGLAPAVRVGRVALIRGLVRVISLRYHAVSIAAVFLALAVGVVLGVERRLRPAARRPSSTAGRRPRARRCRPLTAERDALSPRSAGADEFAARIGPAAVRGLLAGQDGRVRHRSAPTPADRDALVTLIGAGRGDRVRSRSRSPRRSATRRAPTSSASSPRSCCRPGRSCRRRPTPAAWSGACSAACCWARDGWHRRHARADSVLTGLTAPGSSHPAASPGAGRPRCWCSPAGRWTGVDAGDAAAVTARLAAQLDRSRAPGRCWPGGAGSADATGAVGVARADPAITAGLSTVDDVQTGAGPGLGGAGAARAARRAGRPLRHRGHRGATARLRRPWSRSRAARQPETAGSGGPDRRRRATVR